MSKYDANNVTWKQHGIGFGVFIYVLNTFVIPYFSDLEITVQSILFMIPICVAAGYAFGRFKKWQAERNS
ncbi:MAG: hypothetical protein ACJAV5_000078 [Vicingaceae bacterium]|jgi:hypothetical protein